MNTKAKYFIVFCLFYSISAGYLHGQSKEIIRMNLETKNLTINQITTSGKLITLINKNKNGRIIKQHSLYKKEYGLDADIYNNESISTHQYDERNRLIESNFSSTKYRIYLSKQAYEYTNFDSLLKVSFYSNYGDFDYLIKHSESIKTYNENKLLVKQENYRISSDQDKKFLKDYTISYIYNDKRKLIREDYVYVNSNTFSYFYKYDNAENLIEVIYPNTQKTLKYNQMSQLILEEIFSKFNHKDSTYKLKESLTLNYDSANKLTGTTKTYFGDNYNGKKLVSSYTENFNQDGQKILSESTNYTNDINKNKPLNKEIYEYYPNKKLKKKTSEIFNVVSLDLFDTYKHAVTSTEIYEYEEAQDLDDSLFDAHLIYPNPANNEINIVNTLESGCLSKISLLDMLGNNLADFAPVNVIGNLKNQCNWKLQVSNFPVGTYLIVMTNSQGGVATKKIIVNR